MHHEQHGRGREDRGQPDRQKPALCQGRPRQADGKIRSDIIGPYKFAVPE